jgi:uncharacterized membrane protein
MKAFVPLTEKHESDNYTLHYYNGFDPSMAISICEDMLRDVNVIDPINIYLYIVDYPHDFKRFDRIGYNNGYMQKSGSCYSIVILRKLFWPKVLIHEILHILWYMNNLPICNETPRWDESIIESHAVKLAISKGYINETEYNYYIRQCKKEISNILGGDISKLMKTQKTHVYEYIYLSNALTKLQNNVNGL